MSYSVNFDLDHGIITVDQKNYTLKELESKLPKSKIDNEVIKTYKSLLDARKGTIEALNRSQLILGLNVEYDDVSELVASDMFKGDNHSRALIQ